jgi:HEXXH motif-containing protein
VKKGTVPFFFQTRKTAPIPGPVACWRNELSSLRRLIAQSRTTGAPGSASWSRLVERVGDEGMLSALAPSGRIPSDFRARVRRHAESRWKVLRRRGPLEHSGSSPQIGDLLVERGLEVISAGPAPGFGARVTRALAILDTRFPEAAALVRSRTWRVVPVAEWATVSYSSATEPGVAYINVKSAPLLRLAEDLLHESVHIRLHEIEARSDFVTTSGRDERFYSPWRREWRPLRGLLHAVCTFTAGAMFFDRMRTGPWSESRRRWLARRLLEERASVAMTLVILENAARRGLLTRAGRRVVRDAVAAHRSLAAAEARARRNVSKADLARVGRLVASLRRQPVRWSWR